MYCEKCGKRIADDSLFCNYCGEMLKKHDNMLCPNCGCTFAADQLYCDRCGTSLVPAASPEQHIPEARQETSPALPQQPPKTKKPSAKVITATVIVSLIVFAVAMFLLLWLNGVINW